MSHSKQRSSQLTIGVDLGDKLSEICILGPQGACLQQRSLETTPKGFGEFFGQFPCSTVVFEVGTHSRWVQKLLKSPQRTVITANPTQIALITRSHKKTDRADAQILARLGQAMPEMLSPVEHRSDEAQADLALAEARKCLVEERTSLVVRIRGWVKSAGGRIEGCSAEQFYSRAPEQVPEHMRVACAPLFVMLRTIHEQIRNIDKEMRQRSRCKPEIELLQSIPGVGPVTAFSFSATIEKPERFAHSRDVGAYLGLVPAKRDSGERSPQLGITKAGNRDLRRLLVLCAHYILGRHCQDCQLRRWGLSLCERGGKSAKKRAVVAVARKLAVHMLAIWKKSELYDPMRGIEEVVEAA